MEELMKSTSLHIQASFSLSFY